MNFEVEDSQAMDTRLDELWVATVWNQLSVEPLR